MIEEHKLYEILIESFNRHIQNGGCIFDWIKSLTELGCKIEAEPKNLMLASLNLKGFVSENKRQRKIKGHFCVKTNCFGNVYFPQDFALKCMSLNYMP
jgi:hypothetical protein